MGVAKSVLKLFCDGVEDDPVVSSSAPAVPAKATKGKASSDEEVTEAVPSGEIDKELEAMDKEIDELEKKRDTISKRLFDRSKDIAIIKEVEKIRADINRKKDKIRAKVGNILFL